MSWMRNLKIQEGNKEDEFRLKEKKVTAKVTFLFK